jgi:hypothetical protein
LIRSRPAAEDGGRQAVEKGKLHEEEEKKRAQQQSAKA